MRVLTLSGLVVALVASSGPAQAVEVGARFRALAACGVAKPGPERDWACAPFSTLERGTWRAYDGPGAGAPREYELPKPYELDPYR